MSLVKLQKITFAGLIEDKVKLIEDLQNLGCMEVVPLKTDLKSTAVSTTPAAREALMFLKAYRKQRRQIRDPSRFDPVSVEQQVLDVRQRLSNLEQERDFLLRRLQAFSPWGDFNFPDPAELGGRRLWFYPLPRQALPVLVRTGHTYQIINQDNRFVYVVIVSEQEPLDIPAPRVHLGNKSRRQLDQRLDEVELAIEDTEAERAYLTRWSDLLSQNLNQLEDRAARAKLAEETYDRDLAFGLFGWAPVANIPTLKQYAEANGYYFKAEDPGPEDQPPSLLRNAKWFKAGEDLVNFYMTPGYRTWDPSTTVFLSFALFFGMILSDAGYAILLAFLLALYWRKMGRSPAGLRYRYLGVALVFCGLLWGALIGSWFGIEPTKDSLLGHLHIMNMSDANQMMAISVFIGCSHVILANMADAIRRKNWQERLAPFGWALAVAGGLGLGGASLLENPALKLTGYSFLCLGLLAVLLFSKTEGTPLQRLLGGLHGLTEVSRAFGDVLSYLRLFALGMAGASLAVEFNHMAEGIMTAVPGVGLFFGVLLLILGHTLNLIIGIAAAVIHGLRLNVIEFFNWSLKEEGTLFQPFRRKQDS